MRKIADDLSIIDLFLEARGYGHVSRVVTAESLAAHGDSPVWLAWIEARYQQLALMASTEHHELADLGVDCAALYEAAWRCQYDANERWYKPYLFDHEGRAYGPWRVDAEGRPREIHEVRLP